MHRSGRSAFLGILLLMSSVTQASDDVKDRAVTLYDRENLALERKWGADQQAKYFSEALALFRARNAAQEMNPQVQSAQLDLASGVLLKTRDGSEYGSDAGAVRNCQAAIIRELVAVNIEQLERLPNWADLRARYARLLMYQRATWLGLRDPALDDQSIELDSTIRMEPDPAAEERLLRNQRIALQLDLKHFLKEAGPAIDRFMISLFSRKPEDFRMLNELLAMGLYTPAERSKLVTNEATARNKK
jgi:hypothetical protein